MTPMTLKYPEDWSGTLASNRISGERHTVPRVKNKCFALDGGPFFSDSMVLTVATTGQVLVRNVDYKPLFLYQDASIYAGQEINAAIAIINDDISGDILVDYQIIGGVYVSLIDALYQAIEALQLDDRTIDWDDIKNKPELYPPEPHIHHVSALYGTEHICMAIYALKQAILIGNAAETERIWDGLDQLRKDMMAGDAANTDLMYKHINRVDNPHEVTKAQVGLGLVVNYAIANRAEAEAAVAPDKYMTAQTVGWAIAKLAGDLINAHVTDYNNPHKTTKAQVNLGNVDNFATATNAEATAGVVTNKFVTPYLVKIAIDKFAGDALNAHIADKTNPHGTTKAQVGLGNVDNFATATNAEALAGTAADRFMTASLVMTVVNKVVTDTVNAHINNKNNPHGVTKAQVGLSLVNNYMTASDDVTAAGTTNTQYVTPTGVKAAISQQALVPINNHINNKANPHATTKTHVGLGSVNNYATATTDAQGRGKATNLYLTPASGRWAADGQINDRLYNGSSGDLVRVSGANTWVANTLYFSNSGVYWQWNGSAIYTNANVNVANVYVRSDERAKHDIVRLGEEQISDGLFDMATYISRYKLNEDQGGTGELEIGTIAQGVQKHFPELVREDKDGMLRLMTSGYVSVLHKGFAEHEARLRAIETALGLR